MGFWENSVLFIEDTIVTPFTGDGPPFYKVFRVTWGSGGLPDDPSPALSIWIARGGRNSRSVTRERLGWWERGKWKGNTGLGTCLGCRAKTVPSFLSYFLKTLSIGTVRLRESNPLPPRLHSQYKHSIATDFVGLLEDMYMEIKTKLVHLLQQNLQINSSIVCKVIF